jgi:hypothetical protein
MDSLQNILGQKNFDTPDEITAVQDYIKHRYGVDATVKLQREALIVSLPSAALAATLQMDQARIIESCSLTKRLVIRTVR